jgi:hypothetical protein
MLSVEFARRTIPSEVRPTFKEMEDYCKRGGDKAPAAEKAA